MQSMSLNTEKSCPPPYIPNEEKLSAQQLQAAYDEMAGRYEKRIWFDQHVLGVARQRKRLFNRARGAILDVAAGTGLNFPYFPAASQVVAVDLSERMLEAARQRASRLQLNVRTQVMNAEKLEFPDAAFDTVTSSLSTCTFPDPIQALREMKRVCRPDGQLLLLEHGHSSIRWLADQQDRHVLPHYQQSAGCRWNQEPLELVKAAGLHVLERTRFGLGIFHAIVACPSQTSDFA